MRVYIEKSGNLVVCHWYLTNTHWQTTEYRATQLLLSIKFKLSHAIFWFSLSSIECPLVFNAVSVTIGIEVAVLKNSPSPSTSKSVLMLNPINSPPPPSPCVRFWNPIRQTRRRDLGFHELHTTTTTARWWGALSGGWLIRETFPTQLGAGVYCPQILSPCGDQPRPSS